ncbi:hypothetical protein D3C71_1675160 [compost metagenome]
MRQHAVFATHDEHVRELQALGRMQRHHPHLVAAVVLVVARYQRQLRGHVGGAGATRAALEPRRQLFDVVGAALVTGGVLGLVAHLRQQARILGDTAHQITGSHITHVHAQRAQDVGELAQAVGRTR